MTTEGMFTSDEVRAFVSGPLFDPDIITSHDTSYPRISVVVPSLNQGAFLTRTLLSILNQNYPNTEIIVMDGGSNDESGHVIREFEPYIDYWVSESDKGQPHAINKGFCKATGDLIGWQNSDDLYLPGFFHTVAESYTREPAAQLFAANVYTIDEFDEITWASRFAPFSLRHLIYMGWNLSSQATFLRGDMIQRIGPMREDIQVGFDWDWFIRAGKVIRRTVINRRYGGCYRIHAASKLVLYPKESRRPIQSEILRSHGIRVKEDQGDEEQWRWRRRLLKFRHILLLGLLYYPVNRSGVIKRAPFPSVSYPIISMVRPLVLRVLSRLGQTRIL